MSFSPATSALLLVDYQTQLMPAIKDAKAIVDNARRLAQSAGLLEIPVFATEQNRPGFGETVADLSGFARSMLPKRQFDATKEAHCAESFPPTEVTSLFLAMKRMSPYSRQRWDS